jgi:hypothetical protein
LCSKQLEAAARSGRAFAHGLGTDDGLREGLVLPKASASTDRGRGSTRLRRRDRPFSDRSYRLVVSFATIW